MRFICYSLLLILVQGITWAQTSPPAYESEQLKIIPINEKVLIHESYLQTDSWGKVGCNGMLFIDGSEAIVFDTPTDNKGAEELIEWLNERQVTIKAVVATHFHEDCLGGINAFHAAGISSFANAKTISLLEENNATVFPQKSFNGKLRLKIGKQKVHLFHPGEGHTSDNVVGYIPTEETLFGGCLIKSMNASKGYLGDANVEAWSATVAGIKKKWPDLRMVIPGHGKSGGTELLDYTMDLFSEE